MTLIPDDRVKETPLFRAFAMDFEYYRAKYDEHKENAEKLAKELEELKASRKQFIAELQDEEQARRKAMEAEMKRLEADLTRIRGNRDQLHQQLELRNSKDEVEFQQIQQIRLLANERKDRIEALESELRRCKMEMAANGGQPLLVEFFASQKDTGYGEHLEEKIRLLEEQLDLCKAEKGMDITQEEVYSSI